MYHPWNATFNLQLPLFNLQVFYAELLQVICASFLVQVFLRKWLPSETSRRVIGCSRCQVAGWLTCEVSWDMGLICKCQINLTQHDSQAINHSVRSTQQPRHHRWHLWCTDGDIEWEGNGKGSGERRKLRLSEITLLFDLSLDSGRTLSQRKAKWKAIVTQCCQVMLQAVVMLLLSL